MRKSFITIANGILIFLLIFAVHPTVAFADDGTPTPDETAAVEETPLPEESAEVTEISNQLESTKAKETEEPETILTETPFADGLQTASTPELEELPQQTEPEETQELTPTEVLEQAPTGTQFVVLDDEGQVEPLVSQEAAEIVSNGDPMWCPAGVLPGGAGCSNSYTSFEDLLVDLGSFSGDGTIYVANTYNSALETDDITIDGSVYANLGALTIQGGWDGVPGAANIVGISTFDGVSFEIRNWTGPITVQDIRVLNTLYGLEIDTAGAVRLKNVEATGTTANNGINIQAGGDIDLNTVNSSSNFESGADLSTTNGNVSISNSTFNNNSGSSYTAGVEIASPGTVTLSNVTANSNQDDGIAVSDSPEVHLNNVTVDNNGWDGAYVDGLCTKVFVSNGRFTNNGFIYPDGGYGLEVDNAKVYQSGTPVYSNNSLGAINQHLDPCFIVQPPSKEDKPPKTGYTIPVKSGQLTHLICDEAVITLVTPKDTHATFKNLCNYEVFVFDESSSDLNSRLPVLGLPYYSGFTITILYENNEINTLPAASDIVISFRISDDVESLNQDYAIYYWNGTSWVEMTETRKVYDRVEVTTKNAGTYVLVVK